MGAVVGAASWSLGLILLLLQEADLDRMQSTCEWPSPSAAPLPHPPSPAPSFLIFGERSGRQPRPRQALCSIVSLQAVLWGVGVATGTWPCSGDGLCRGDSSFVTLSEASDWGTWSPRAEGPSDISSHRRAN